MALTTVTGSLVSVNAIQGTLIADNAITAVHIATNAVSGTLIADNAVTAVHIAQNSITVTQLADDCVESDKIADGIITTNHLNKAMISSQTEVSAATGDFVLLGDTSDSNNLKKTPVSSIIGLASGTTINNNADNRIITGSGTANTLEGESGLTYNGSTLAVTGTIDIDSNGGVDNYYLRFKESGADRFTMYENSNNVYLNGGPGNTIFRPRQNGGTGNFAVIGSNVGIGETTPLGKLHIKSGDSAASSVNGNANELVVENSDYTGITILGENETSIMFGDNEDPDVGRIEYFHSTNTMSFRTNGSDAMKIASNGDVQLQGGNQMTNAISWWNAATYELASIENVSHSSYNDSGGLVFKTAGLSNSGMAERMRIDSSGRVGIGTNDPSSGYGGTITAAKLALLSGTSGSDGGSSTLLIGGDNKHYAYMQGTHISGGSTRLDFGTANGANNPTLKMRIHPAGNVVVSTSGAAISTFYNGAGSNTGWGGDVSGYLAAVRGGVNTPLYVSHSGTGSGQFISFSQSTTGRGYINWTGSALQLTSTSDHRLKENVVPIPNATTRINALNPISYDMIENGESAEGFLAHELQEHVPHAVTGTHNEVYTEADLNEEDLEDLIGTPKYQTVSYASLTPLLVKALQESNAKIAELEARIETLEE